MDGQEAAAVELLIFTVMQRPAVGVEEVVLEEEEVLEDVLEEVKVLEEEVQQLMSWKIPVRRKYTGRDFSLRTFRTQLS